MSYFNYPDRARQLIDYSELECGGLMPTDIDGFFEYHDKAFVMFEYKYKDAKMSKGQQIALERAVDAFQKAGKCGVLLLCRHDVTDTSQVVNAARATVTDLYYKGKWRDNINKPVMQVKEDIIKFVEK